MNGYYGGYGSYNYTPQPACHHEPTCVTSIEGIEYYCADRDGVAEFVGDAAINFTGASTFPQLAHIPQLAAQIDCDYEEIVVTWTDYGLPRVKSTFWKALHDYCKSRGWKKVCLHCIGGHGRTGTAICAMMIAVEKWTVQDAVEYVREEYCRHAVESSSQCDYLCGLDEELNDREISPDQVPESSAAITFRDAKTTQDENLSNIVSKHMGWFDEDGSDHFRGG